MKWIVPVLSFFLLINLTLAEPQDELGRKTREIALEIFSPFCPGRSVEDCPSENAHKLKDEIRAELALGKSKKEIIDSLVEQYGPEIRAMPDSSGIGLLAWLFPLLFLATGFFFIVRNIKKPQ